jgi:propanol-preferring alcohol dehydrogenase
MGAASVVETAFELPRQLDSAILFAPDGALVPAAMSVLKRGGKLVIAGIHLSDIPQLNYQQHLFFEKSIQSVTAFTDEDATTYLELAARHGIKPNTTYFSLANANEALMKLKNDEIKGSAVLSILPSK